MPAVTASLMDRADEFSELVQRHRGIVLKVAASYAAHRDDRDELAQEIAAQLWAAWPGYDRERPFSTWMYRVALNTAMAHARSLRLRRAHVEHVEAPPEAAPGHASAPLEAESAVLLDQVMRSLDSGARALLLLHLEARSSAEIAEILGLTVSAVTTRLHRIRQQLRERFALDEGATP